MLCYGDSNTYGYDPRGFFGDRYPKEDRWVDILAGKTGWNIINEGQNGREIPRHPHQYLRLEELLTQNSPDVFTVMLGTNDLLKNSSAEEAASRMEAFLLDIQSACGAILLIAPPSMKRGEWVTQGRLVEESVKLAREYNRLAQRLGIRFADAGGWGVSLTFDGVHFTQEGHRTFAEALCAYLI